MEINVNFLNNLRVEAKFDEFSVIADQPIRYKGDGSAPGPFDYFLASSAMCAAYFVRVYCLSRQIPTDNIRLVQNNIVDPDNRYRQIFHLQLELPKDLEDKHRQGILRSIDRCTVKKVIQTMPEFKVELVDNLDEDAQSLFIQDSQDSRTFIVGKDLALEQTIANMTGILANLGIKIEIASWRNLVPNVWSLHLRDAASPMCFTNGKGNSKNSALCSALGEYIERLNCNFFYNDQYFGTEISHSEFVHYANEKWFKPGTNDELPAEILDDYCLTIYNPDGQLRGSHLIDTNSGMRERGICSLPFERQSDGKIVYFPSNLLENLFVSNGMSAGNSLAEAHVQCLSEIFERAVKKHIIANEIILPDVPQDVLNKYSSIVAGIEALEQNGFSVLIKDASLGGQFPVICVTLMNPKTGGVFASFGAHPKFEVALERSLTELLQGRSFAGLDDVPKPTFNSMAVSDAENFIEHFIDSTGVISWRFFSDQANFAFSAWDFSGTTTEEAEYLFTILKNQGNQVYVANYHDLGGIACRIIVPGYSEIYPIEDLIWNNTNVALDFREDILTIHALNDTALANLLQRLEDSQIDDYMVIRTLIGIEFDENTVWGQLTIVELKLLICLALQDLEQAKDCVEQLLQYNDNTTERNLFFQAVDTVLAIQLNENLNLKHYLTNLKKIFGAQTLHNVLGSVDGSIKFYGLFATSMQLEGIDKHLRLLASYKKIHHARKRFHATLNTEN